MKLLPVHEDSSNDPGQLFSFIYTLIGSFISSVRISLQHIRRYKMIVCCRNEFDVKLHNHEYTMI